MPPLSPILTLQKIIFVPFRLVFLTRSTMPMISAPMVIDSQTYSNLKKRGRFVRSFYVMKLFIMLLLMKHGVMRRGIKAGSAIVAAYANAARNGKGSVVVH